VQPGFCYDISRGKNARKTDATPHNTFPFPGVEWSLIADFPFADQEITNGTFLLVGQPPMGA
jgi:hypothetical protein